MTSLKRLLSFSTTSRPHWMCGQSAKVFMSTKFGKTTCIGVVWLENAEVITGSERVREYKEGKSIPKWWACVLDKIQIYIGNDQTDRNVSAMREIENSNTILVKNMKGKQYFETLAIDGGARGSTVGWGTALQVGRSRVRFPMVSLKLFIYIILPAALWPWGWLSP